MTTTNLTDYEKKEMMKLSKVISQFNRQNMIELAEISKALRESLNQEWLVLIQQLRENQSTMLREIYEINWKSIKSSMDNLQQIEFTALKEAMKTSSSFYSDYLKSIQDIVNQSSIQEFIKTSKILSLAYADTLSSFGAIIEFKPKIKIPKIQKLIQEEVKQNIDT